MQLETFSQRTIMASLSKRYYRKYDFMYEQLIGFDKNMPKSPHSDPSGDLENPNRNLLSNWSDNALARGAQARSFRPAHLLQHLEAHVLCVKLVVLVLAAVPHGARFQCLNSGNHE